MRYGFRAAALISGALSRITPARRWLDIRKVDVWVSGLDAPFDGYRIAQFSDLHFDGVTTTRARLTELVAAINGEQPDLIAFAGDFVTDGLSFRLADLITPLRELHAPKVAVMGNHDYRLSEGLVTRAMRDAGMINLNNAVYSVRRDDACLHIGGVDSLIRHRSRLDLVLAQLPESGKAILLAHEPEFADVSTATRRFALQLSGHTHGGQIRIPILTRLLLRARYLRGMFYVSGMALYVNRGIGMVGLPVRFRCPSELTILTLRAFSGDLSDPDSIKGR